jgi:hypothetical protein
MAQLTNVFNDNSDNVYELLMSHRNNLNLQSTLIPRLSRVRSLRFRKLAGYPQEWHYVIRTLQWTEASKALDNYFVASKRFRNYFI